MLLLYFFVMVLYCAPAQIHFIHAGYGCVIQIWVFISFKIFLYCRRRSLKVLLAGLLGVILRRENVSQVRINLHAESANKQLQSWQSTPRGCMHSAANFVCSRSTLSKATAKAALCIIQVGQTKDAFLIWRSERAPRSTAATAFCSSCLDDKIVQTARASGRTHD
jgi:hypothetical protein